MPGEPDRLAWLEERLATLDRSLPTPPDLPDAVAVGFDGTAPSVNAARWGGRLADTVHLITALPEDPSHGLGPIERQQAEHWAEGVRARLPDALRALSSEMAEVRMELHEVEDRPEPGLEAQATRLGASVLAIGTDEKGTLDRLVMGSVGETMLHSAREPTLLARGPPKPGPIIVGLGTDPGSPWAAAWGYRLAEHLDRDLVLVHAAREPSARPGFTGRVGTDQAVVDEPPAVQALVEQAKARQAALVVVGHDPRRRFGSTAVGVLRQAPCTVFIARPTDVLDRS